jgi:hypothetical protein
MIFASLVRNSCTLLMYFFVVEIGPLLAVLFSTRVTTYYVTYYSFTTYFWKESRRLDIA